MRTILPFYWTAQRYILLKEALLAFYWVPRSTHASRCGLHCRFSGTSLNYSDVHYCVKPGRLGSTVHQHETA